MLRLLPFEAHSLDLRGGAVHPIKWFAGGVCLAVMIARAAASTGPATAIVELVYFVEIGVISQAAALLASLIAVQRRQSHSRGEAFLYQLAGLAAALAVFWVWDAADPVGSPLPGHAPTDFIV